MRHLSNPRRKQRLQVVDIFFAFLSGESLFSPLQLVAIMPTVSRGTKFHAQHVFQCLNRQVGDSSIVVAKSRNSPRSMFQCLNRQVGDSSLLLRCSWIDYLPVSMPQSEGE
jgi:hypothetical protein